MKKIIKLIAPIIFGFFLVVTLMPNVGFIERGDSTSTPVIPEGEKVVSLFTDQAMDALPEVEEVPAKPSKITVYGHLTNGEIVDLTDSCSYEKDSDPDITTGVKKGTYKLINHNLHPTVTGENLYAYYHYIVKSENKTMLRRITDGLSVDVPFVFEAGQIEGDRKYACDMSTYKIVDYKKYEFIAFTKFSGETKDPENPNIDYISYGNFGGFRGYFTLKNSSLGANIYNLQFTMITEVTKTYYVGFIHGGLCLYQNLNEEGVKFDWTLATNSYVCCLKLVYEPIDVFFPGYGISTPYGNDAITWGGKRELPAYEVLLDDLTVHNGMSEEATNILTVGSNLNMSFGGRNAPAKNINITSDDEDVLKITKNTDRPGYTFEVLKENAGVSCTINIDGEESKYKKYFYTTIGVEDRIRFYFANEDYSLFPFGGETNIETKSSVNLINQNTAFLYVKNKGATFEVVWNYDGVAHTMTGNKTLRSGLGDLYQIIEVDGKKIVYCPRSKYYLGFADGVFCCCDTPQFINLIDYNSDIEYEFVLGGLLENRSYLPGDDFDPTGLKVYILYKNLGEDGTKLDITDEIVFNKVPWGKYITGMYRNSYVRLELFELDVALPIMDTLKVNNVPNYIFPGESIDTSKINLEIDLKNSKQKYHKKYSGDDLLLSIRNKTSYYEVDVFLKDNSSLSEKKYVDIIDDKTSAFKFESNVIHFYVGEETPIVLTKALRYFATISYSFVDDNPSEDVISIDSKGVVTGLLPGSGTITANINHGGLGGTQVISCNFLVYKNPETISFLEESVNLYKGETSNYSLYFEYGPEDVNNLDLIAIDQYENEYDVGDTIDGNCRSYIYLNLNNLEVGQYILQIMSRDKEKVFDSCVVNLLNPDIVLETDHVLLSSGSTYQINAVPHTSFNFLRFDSNNYSVAYVNNEGVVTAYEEGFAVITITAGSGTDEVTKNFYVTVGEVEAVPVEDIDIISILEIPFAETYQLEPVVKPSNATFKNVIYSSSNPQIVTVDEDGLAFGNQIGTAKIYVSSENGEVKKVIDVSVVENPNPIAVKTITLSYDVYRQYEVGDVGSIYATISPTYATNQELTWTSSDESVISFFKENNSGEFSCVGVGSAVITATSVSNPEVSKSVEITVKNYNLTDFEVDVENNTININKCDDYQVEIKSTEPEYYDGIFNYHINNTRIATVDENGLIHANKYGSTTLIVSDQNYNVAKTITINVLVGEFNLTQETYSGYVGGHISVKNEENISSSYLTYSCLDENVATVSSDGTLTFVSEGETTLVVSAKDGSYLTTAKVSVSERELEGFELKEDNITLTIGESYLIEINSIIPKDAECPTFICESSNEEIAVVNGLSITAIGEGTCYINVYPEGFEELAKVVTVTVNEEELNVINFTIHSDKNEYNVGEHGTISIIGEDNQTPASASFASSNTKVIIIDNTGKITAVGEGTSTITATFVDINGNTSSSTLTIVVKDKTSHDEEDIDDDKDQNDPAPVEKTNNIVKIAAIAGCSVAAIGVITAVSIIIAKKKHVK